MTRQMLLTLDDIIRDRLDIDGPRWSQKFYVAYRIGSRNWLTIATSSGRLRLRFLVDAGAFSATDLAESLSVEEFDKEGSLAEKLGLPSSVLVQSLNEATDRVILRVKKDFNLMSDTFAEFLERAYEAFPR